MDSIYEIYFSQMIATIIPFRLVSNRVTCLFWMCGLSLCQLFGETASEESSELNKLYLASQKAFSDQAAIKQARESQMQLLRAVLPDNDRPILQQQVYVRKSDTQALVFRNYLNLRNFESLSQVFFLDSNQGAVIEPPKLDREINLKYLLSAKDYRDGKGYIFNEASRKWDEMTVPNAFAASQLIFEKVFFEKHPRIQLDQHRLMDELLHAENGSTAQKTLSNELAILQKPGDSYRLLPNQQIGDFSKYEFKLAQNGLIEKETEFDRAGLKEQSENCFVSNLPARFNNNEVGVALPAEFLNCDLKRIPVVGFRWSNVGEDKVVSKVFHNTPAHIVGLKPGDVIKSIKGSSDTLTSVSERLQNINYEFEIVVSPGGEGPDKILHLKTVLLRMQIPKDPTSRITFMQNLF
ncbi:MAG: hypothetical protein ACOYM3_13680 [Terrimicrobiaceae bacterium]